MLALPGIVLGLLLGGLLARYCTASTLDAIDRLYASIPQTAPHLDSALVLRASAAGLLMAVLAALWPALRAARVDPALVIRCAASVETSAPRPLPLGLAGASLFGLAWLPELGSGKGGGALAITSTVLGAALATPLFVSWLRGATLRPIEALFDMPGRLALDYVGRTLGRSTVNTLHRTFASSHSVEVVTLLIALMGVIGTMAAAMIDRRRELAMLRAKRCAREVSRCAHGSSVSSARGLVTKVPHRGGLPAPDDPRKCRSPCGTAHATDKSREHRVEIRLRGACLVGLARNGPPHPEVMELLGQVARFGFGLLGLSARDWVLLITDHGFDGAHVEGWTLLTTDGESNRAQHHEEPLFRLVDRTGQDSHGGALMELLSFTVLGFVVGIAIHAWLRPDRHEMGTFSTTALGLAGSLAGWLIGVGLCPCGLVIFQPVGLAAAVTGSCSLVLIGDLLATLSQRAPKPSRARRAASQPPTSALKA